MAFIFASPAIEKILVEKIKAQVGEVEVWKGSSCNAIMIRDTDWEVAADIVYALPGPCDVWGVPPGEVASVKMRAIPDDCPRD